MKLLEALSEILSSEETTKHASHYQNQDDVNESHSQNCGTECGFHVRASCATMFASGLHHRPTHNTQLRFAIQPEMKE